MHRLPLFRYLDHRPRARVAQDTRSATARSARARRPSELPLTRNFDRSCQIKGLALLTLGKCSLNSNGYFADLLTVAGRPLRREPMERQGSRDHRAAGSGEWRTGRRVCTDGPALTQRRAYASQNCSAIDGSPPPLRMRRRGYLCRLQGIAKWANAAFRAAVGAPSTARPAESCSL